MEYKTLLPTWRTRSHLALEGLNEKVRVLQRPIEDVADEVPVPLVVRREKGRGKGRGKGRRSVTPKTTVCEDVSVSSVPVSQCESFHTYQVNSTSRTYFALPV